jgi:FKBP-type peptidyl-prolyl cis-trans isomerase 2
MNRAKQGDRVQVKYRELDDGAGARKSRRPRLLEFTVGGGEVMRGLSFGVVGMAEGEQKQLTLHPKDAYGPVRRNRIKEHPRQWFPEHMDLSAGKRLVSIGSTTGRRRPVQIVAVRPGSVVVDYNHPLAGKVVKVNVQLVALDPQTEGSLPAAQHVDDDGAKSG